MSTSPLLASAIFAILAVLLLLLPFLPCWREWQRPTDVAALPIVRDEVNNVHYLANAFHEQASRADEQCRRIAAPADGFPWHAAQQPVIVEGALRVGGVLACPQPVYTGGDALLPGGAHLAALLCKGDAAFGPETRISEWAHADGAVSVGPGSIVLYRVSAGGTLTLGKGSGFCRMHAPVIRFGTHQDRAAQPQPETCRLSAAWPGATLLACEAGRYRADGDVHLPANHYLEGTLIAGGELRLDDGATILGAVKGRRGVRLGRGAQVHGALVCEGDIDIGPDCWIKGPIVCEGDVRLARGARIGTEDMPTTVAASRVLAETGVTAHGTVWAREAGVVAA